MGIGLLNISEHRPDYPPFYEYKVKSYEGGISTPFIAHWPNQIIKNVGKIYLRPACLTDIMPTIIDATDAKYPKIYPDGTELYPLVGISLIPAFVKGKSMEHVYIFWEHSGFSAIRKGDWKAYKKVNDTEWELYDLRTDRDEQNNVAAKQPELVKELNDK